MYAEEKHCLYKTKCEFEEMNMRTDGWLSFRSVRALALGMALLYGGSLPAQSPARTSDKTPAASATPMSDEALEATREELFNLLKISPRLTGVVAHDPSLLANKDYVEHNNPELAKFLESHPEVVRNPEFYLFANINTPGRQSRRLRVDDERVFFDVRDQDYELAREFMRNFIPFLVIIIALVGVMWVVRVALEDRRWSRLFRAQNDIQNKVLDRFGTSEEFLAYMRGDAGKRFFESLAVQPAAPFSSNPLGRILLPMQIGVVLTLGGIGLIWVRGSVPDVASPPLLVFGVLALTLGIGFVISAALSLLLARHLGMLPERSTEEARNAGVPGINH
jgi:hypothetical protein